MGPCAHHRHQQQRNRHQAFELRFFSVTHFAPTHIYYQTMLCTEAFTQSSVYAQVFLHREVCAQKNFCAQTPLHTEVFTQRIIFFTYRCFIQRCFCAHKQRHVGIFTHRNFATEKPLHRTVFTLRFFGTKKNRHKENSPRRLHQKNTPIFFHAATLPRTVFTQQKLFRTETFTGRFF